MWDGDPLFCNRGGQQARSSAEQDLPEYIRYALDRARSFINPMANTAWTREQATNYVNSFLPPGDPGRL